MIQWIQINETEEIAECGILRLRLIRERIEIEPRYTGFVTVGATTVGRTQWHEDAEAARRQVETLARGLWQGTDEILGQRRTGLIGWLKSLW